MRKFLEAAGEGSMRTVHSPSTGRDRIANMASCAMSPKMSRSGIYGVAPLAAEAAPLRARALQDHVVEEPST